jgi:GDP-D-mannose dehydratase
VSGDLRVYDSSGNIFEDMGMRDADERLAKAELARIIRTKEPDEIYNLAAQSFVPT